MQRFWLGTWDVGAAAPGVAATAAAPLAASRARRLAIEVLQDGSKIAVLLSAADGLRDGSLRCLIGFANDAAECSTWRSRGFPVVEAAFRRRDDGWLELTSPFFAEGQSAMRYGELLLALRGIDFTAAGPASDAPAASYRQFQEAPEPRRPGSFVLRREVHWDLPRSGVRALAPRTLEIRAPRTRSPSLAPLADGTVALTHAWTGVCEGAPQPTFPVGTPTSVPRAQVFGAAAFAFREIEVLGFRIDLGARDLDALVAPLNFPQPGALGGGRRFRAATPVIMLQLLRYGRMQLAGEPQAPLDETDFQSQHELIVRVTTGRSEDGEAQLHDAAVHVPAIFVDNPWSKLLGRDLQGFEKCLADFCVRDAATDTLLRLRPDGLHAGAGEPRDLADVVRVALVDIVSDEGPTGQRALLDIAFDNLDPAVERRLERGGLRDDSEEFTTIAGVARQARLLDAFESIQATPVDDRPLDNAWIEATCALSDRDDEDTPSAIAHLSFHAPEGAPRGWRTLCELLGAPAGGVARVAVQPGDWFRSRFSMDLTVHDD